MKKLMMVGCALVSAFAAFAENPPPYEDYVTLSNSDTTATSFYQAGYWSDGQVPHSDASYYVPAGIQLTYNSRTYKTDWNGGPLVLAGTFSQTVSGSTANRPKIANLTVLNDSILHFPSVYSGFQGGDISVLASEDAPCRVLIPDNATEYTTGRKNIWSANVNGDAGTGLHFLSELLPTRIPVNFVIVSDAFKDFLGTLTLEGHMEFGYNSSSYYTDFGGKVVVGDGTTFDMGSGAVKTEASVAALEVKDGGLLNLGYNAGTARQVLAITDSMKLAAGATVVLDGTSCVEKNGIAAMAKLDSTGRRIRAKAAVLSGDAVANSEIAEGVQVKLLDFDADPFWKESFGDMTLICADGENGTKIVYAGFTNDNFAVNVANDKDVFSGAQLWAGGILPVAGNDIIFTSSGRFYITSEHDDILPSSRVIWAGFDDGDITMGVGTLNFKSLDVFGTTTCSIRQSSSGTRKLTGGPLTIHDGASLNFGVWNQTASNAQYRRNATIEQEIRGNGTLRIYPFSADASNRLDIVSINTNWNGRFVFQLRCNSRSDGHYSTQITNALCWGGTFLADTNTYSAVTISNTPCVYVPNDVCFNDPTRGFFLQDAPRFKVEEGAKLTLSNQVTYAGIVEKEGAGVLNLGGTARFEDGQPETVPVEGRCGLLVSGGALEVSSRAAVDGLDVSFAAGTKLIVGKDCGFTNVKSANPLTTADEQLPVEIAGFDEKPENDGEVTVLTLNKTAAEGIGTDKFVFTRTRACKVLKFEKREVGDNVEYVATIEGKKGILLIVR